MISMTTAPNVRATVTPRRSLLAMVAVILALAVAACTGAEEDANAGAINNVRAAAGVPELVRVAELDLKAEAQAERMAKRRGIFHSRHLTSGVTAGWVGIAENVAMAATVDEAQVALEASPAHYENMTNPSFNEVGVGAVARDGVVYVVQIFVHR